MQGRPSSNIYTTPAERFRPMIEAAIAAGVDRSQQVLQLTHGDSSKLKRDPNVGSDEISFENGTMVFIGVRVIEGASRSALGDVNEIVAPAGPADAASSGAKGQKKGAKGVGKPKAETSKAAKPKVAKPKAGKAKAASVETASPDPLTELS